MRVWDIHPGYLSRSRLLGEHREIHAVWTVLVEDRKGYSNHPETNRWRGHLPQLCQRHLLTAAEMCLRGYNHASPLDNVGDIGDSPGFVDPPHEQFDMLAQKYAPCESGRIPLPRRASEFWAHHKYSVLARGHENYTKISGMSKHLGGLPLADAPDVVSEVCGILRGIPDQGSLVNAWEHVIGHFKKEVPTASRKRWLEYLPDEAKKLGRIIYQAAVRHDETYIQKSTILSDGFRQ